MATINPGTPDEFPALVTEARKHPRGLTTLFFTELWERFSYYGMRSILILYTTAAVADGGLAFDKPHATSLYGSYTMWVYLTALPGEASLPIAGWGRASQYSLAAS